jgi:4a-hydroxytetrahydrobiopterin dehydratase
MSKLSNNEIHEKMKDLDGWIISGTQIRKSYTMKDFMEVVNFINKIAPAAEEMNHHPDFNVYSWNKIDIILSTHSEGGLTNKDFELALKIDNIKGI